MSSSEPQMLISSCAEGVRKLISTERYLGSTISGIADGMVHIDAFTRRNDAGEWVGLGAVCGHSSCTRQRVSELTQYEHLLKDYRRVVSNSEHAAVKLAAAIKSMHNQDVV